jgi:hypothetical protein
MLNLKHILLQTQICNLVYSQNQEIFSHLVVKDHNLKSLLLQLNIKTHGTGKLLYKPKTAFGHI